MCETRSPATAMSVITPLRGPVDYQSYRARSLRGGRAVRGRYGRPPLARGPSAAATTSTWWSPARNGGRLRGPAISDGRPLSTHGCRSLLSIAMPAHAPLPSLRWSWRLRHSRCAWGGTCRRRPVQGHARALVLRDCSRQGEPVCQGMKIEKAKGEATPPAITSFSPTRSGASSVRK
jgi:hypothetical protein